MRGLKPCPFCGEMKEIYPTCRKTYRGTIVFIKCEVCGATSNCKEAEGDPDDEKYWNQSAVRVVESIWNNRVHYNMRMINVDTEEGKKKLIPEILENFLAFVDENAVAINENYGKLYTMKDLQEYIPYFVKTL